MDTGSSLAFGFWLLGVLVFLCLSQFALLFSSVVIDYYLQKSTAFLGSGWLRRKAYFYDVRVSGQCSFSLGVSRKISIAARTP